MDLDTIIFWYLIFIALCSAIGSIVLIRYGAKSDENGRVSVILLWLIMPILFLYSIKGVIELFKLIDLI